MHARVSLLVLLLATAPLTGCIVPQNMTTLRAELGYGETEPEPPLVAKARASTMTPRVDQPVTFTATIEGQPLENVSLDWRLGEAAKTGATVTHSFATPGEVTVNLTAHGAKATTAFDEIPLTVTPNQAPIAEITRQPTGALTPNDTVHLSALASMDPDGDALSYEWIVDGETAAANATYNATYAPGTHTAQLIVSDGDATDQTQTTFAIHHPLQAQASLDATSSSYTLPLEVQPNASKLDVTLTHSTTAGLDDVQLVLLGPDGEEVATAQTEPSPGAESATEHLTVEGSALAAGAHTLEATLERGVSSSITIEGVLTYSALGGATD